MIAVYILIVLASTTQVATTLLFCVLYGTCLCLTMYSVVIPLIRRVTAENEKLKAEGILKPIKDFTAENSSISLTFTANSTYLITVE